MAGVKPWADGPFALIPPSRTGDSKENRVTGTRLLAAEMSIVHNCILRGINSVYVQCVNVATSGSAKDKLDFANYAYRWYAMMQEHHDQEEEYVFPLIEEKAGVAGLMEANVEEHKTFHDGLAAFSQYLESVTEEKEELDGGKLRAIMDSFVPGLRAHLDHEIDTFNGLDKYEDNADWVKVFKESTDKIVAKNMESVEYRQRALPLMFLLHDKSYGEGVWESFPPVPWVVRVVFQWLYMNKHWDWWRFAPCDFAGTPQELPFA
ncbi:hypothetical protein B0I35DRAFT_6629 [Stachybotrys elegans]|uniref:Hemerythrin-like domain-containing protein n=1 Tax=Stachybotrys elegans TaxID=80388 RepID=A0A8K0T6K3_9HYPO|nr:hypothetical protein B0I35DRAFT_6629 [Stachybotrys elegans]